MLIELLIRVLDQIFVNGLRKSHLSERDGTVTQVFG